MRRWRRPQSQCAAVAGQLAIPQPFELDAFCRNIAEQRGRPLLLLPLDGPPDPDLPCGIWIGLDVADLVFYEAGAADILKVHIVLHEISHMLLGHVAPELDVAEDATEEEVAAAERHFQRILGRTHKSVAGADRPDLPVADILRAEAARVRATAAAAKPVDEEIGLSATRIAALLGRTKFASRQEREAETLATLILEKASRNEARSASGQARDVLARLNDAFGHPVRRR
ncbi:MULTISPECIES: hypothetical protein [Streptomycetaceae]|uniref:IrrE N-terminal-like domain-containing protein n=1 Tax=Streptantibioticus cattleyicolor (strain ATCC 35852 / DSM 46488 / JCM 4925 / NBRC 14057 / NRRL 8057) TaxID=1003195 RepID=F8K0G1_STREN|nr:MULTISPECIES: hypothetical protein [Streptomycetaceae]AEW97365.1 hypothetical protein SCATT_49940 [Streptantibioticus cattleyicolor NRRL 8057 = DSM 46488]MYS61815.1 hypothetical protein [Streptomyces sp. SID5468]CCB77688.1 protein of unknown function [Streptantibioticus cattleyicolor NRRL 8057 = DSM 46488]